MTSYLAHRQTVALRPGRRVFRTPAVVISPLTSRVVLTLRRPTAFEWDARTSFQTRIVVRVDGVRSACCGRVTGGARRRGDSTYRLSYGLPYALPDERRDSTLPILTREGLVWRGDGCQYLRTARLAHASRAEAWAEVEQVSGNDCDLDVLGLVSLEALQPLSPVHHSVAFTAAASAIENAGDGVLSVSVSATGANRAAFAGSASANDVVEAHTSSSMTYGGNAMVNVWNVGHDSFFCNAGYRLAGSGVATGSQVVVSSLSLGTVDEHMLGVVTMENVDPTTPVGAHQFSSSPVTVSRSVVVSGVNSDDLVVDNLLMYGGFDFAIGDGQTQRNTVGPGVEAGNLKQSTQFGLDGGAMTWAWSNSGAASLGAVAFKSVVRPNDAGVGIERA